MNLINLLRPLLGVVFVFGLLYSCKKKEGPTAGIEIQPNETQLGLFTTDTFEVVCYSQRLDSVRSDGNALNSVGSYQDPVFGTSKNSFATHFRLSSENIDVNKLRTFVVDSVVLACVYSSYYGDLDAQNFSVYRINEDFYLDTAYYSNKKFSTDATPIGKLENYKPNPFLKFTENDEEQSAQLRIRIDSSFGVELFNAPFLAYTSNEEFLKIFKGFLIKTENPAQPTNTGGQMLFDMEDDYSRLLVYYTTPTGDKEKLEYLINDKCAKVNLSDNDYAGSEVGSSFDDPAKGQNNFYVQAMGGVVSVLKIPHIKQLKSKGPVIINQAQFVFNIESGTNVRYSPVPQFFMFGIKEDGNIFDTPDRKEIHYGGKISEALEYKLTMTRYYQQVLNGLYEDRGLMLMELGGNYGRSVIGGPKSSASPLKFVVSYTPIIN